MIRLVLPRMMIFVHVLKGTELPRVLRLGALQLEPEEASPQILGGWRASAHKRTKYSDPDYHSVRAWSSSLPRLTTAH
jgi:hypothetical protein